jgi:hypothetical protein
MLSANLGTDAALRQLNFNEMSLKLCGVGLYPHRGASFRLAQKRSKYALKPKSLIPEKLSDGALQTENMDYVDRAEENKAFAK